MTNLKKTLAVVLAFAMILSMGAVSTFAAYSDVTAGTVVSEAVGILSNLGILTGFEDGTFKPDETVTRAQMAAIICRTLGYEDQAQSSMGTTVFNDVAADHWASGYINVAQAQQIINGYGDGNYGPEDLVTYEQAVKMIVSALGYDLAAQAKGGYPTGYLAIASSEGITKNANGRVGDAAARSTIAVLVYNSLEVRLMDQTSWSTGADGDEYGKTNDTILSKYLEVNKWEGIVTNTALTEVAGGTYNPDNAPKIRIEGYYTFYSGGKLVKSTSFEGGASSIVANSSLVDADKYLGKSVVAYIGEDDELNDDAVFAIAEAKNKNNVTSISAIDLVESTDDEWNVENQISYRKSGSNKVYDLDIEGAALVYVNYDEDSLPSVTDAQKKNSTWALTEEIDNGGRIDFISNDTDDKIEYILITAYDDPAAVIKEVAFEDGIYSFETYTGALEEIDTEDEDALTLVTVDGVAATAADLAVNYTVSYTEIATGLVALYASSKTVTGTVDAFDPAENTVSVAGEEYDLVGLTASALNGEEGIFFLNVDGQIVHNETEATGSAKFALVLAVSYEGGINDAYVAQVMTADGAVAEYEFHNKAKYSTYATAVDTANAIAKKINANTDNLSTTTPDVRKLQHKLANKAIFDVTVKDGKITRIKDVTVSTKKDSKKYDAESMSYSSLTFDDSTVVFALKPAYDGTSTAVIEDDDVTVGAVSDFFVDGEGDASGVALFGITKNSDDDICDAVLGFKLAATVPADSAAVIVTSRKTVTYDDSDATYITGLQAGKEVAYTIYSEDPYTSDVAPEFLGKGDIILVGVANAEGVVSDFDTLYTRNGVNLNAGTGEGKDSDYEDEGEFAPNTLIATEDTNDDIYYVVGNLDKDPKPTSTKFWLESADTTQAGSIDITDGITMKSSANYTLVDYSESETYPEISKKSAGTGVFGSVTKYDAKVFVRYYDDKLVEVVVYRDKAAE